MTPKELGHYGEEVVVGILIRQGWTIQARNFRHIGTEIDIIAAKEKTLIFVEVKTSRKPLRHEQQILSLMTRRKIKSLAQGARKFLEREDKAHDTYRLDFALVFVKGNHSPHVHYWPHAAEIA